jgi:hypothetical protein
LPLFFLLLCTLSFTVRVLLFVSTFYFFHAFFSSTLHFLYTFFAYIHIFYVYFHCHLTFLCLAFFVPSVLHSSSLSFNLFLPFLFIIAFTRSFLYLLLSSFLLYHFTLSISATLPSFFLSYFILPGFNSYFFLQTFLSYSKSFNYHCIILPFTIVNFHFSQSFFIVSSFRLISDTFFPYFISSLNSFIHSTLFLPSRIPSLYRFPIISSRYIPTN